MGDQGLFVKRYVLLVAWLCLFLIGCQAQLNATRNPSTVPQGKGTVAVAIRPAAFSTKTLGSDISDYQVRLLSGSTVQSEFVATGTLAHFTNVPPGLYKVSVEAMLTSSVSATKEGAAFSTGTVTIADGAPPAYSLGGGALTVAVPLVNAGELAPGDGGNPAQTHMWTPNLDGVNHGFVWVPRFTAYQLVNPGNCGGKVRFGVADSARPAGYWVGSRPFAGVIDVDWRVHQLGGFYAGKYEASRLDATNVSAGSSTLAAVQSNVVPWVNVTWVSAAEACRALHPNASLMCDQDWTALAVWSQVHGISVRGNNTNTGTSPCDFDDNQVLFTSDPTDPNAANPVPKRALTASGSNVTWPPNVNTTTHTGLSVGVCDLNGNVAEWTYDLGSDASGNWRVSDAVVTVLQPTPANQILTLSTHGILFAFGVPATLAGTGSAEFGQDVFYPGNGNGNKAYRGLSYQDGSDAGVWSMDNSVDRSNSFAFLGFRPVIRF